MTLQLFVTAACISSNASLRMYNIIENLMTSRIDRFPTKVNDRTGYSVSGSSVSVPVSVSGSSVSVSVSGSSIVTSWLVTVTASLLIMTVTPCGGISFILVSTTSSRLIVTVPLVGSASNGEILIDTFGGALAVPSSPGVGASTFRSRPEHILLESQSGPCLS